MISYFLIYAHKYSCEVNKNFQLFANILVKLDQSEFKLLNKACGRPEEDKG